MKKKLITIAMIAVMAAPFAACGSKEAAPAASGSSTSVEESGDDFDRVEIGSSEDGVYSESAFDSYDASSESDAAGDAYDAGIEGSSIEVTDGAAEDTDTTVVTDGAADDVTVVTDSAADTATAE